MFISNKDLPIFKSGDKVTLKLKYKNRWIDYCPSDGLSIDNKDALCSFVTFSFNGYYYTIIKPNLRQEYQNNCCESWKDDYNRLTVFKYKLSDLIKSANSFNKSFFIYKVVNLVFGDEALFTVLPNSPIYNVRVDTEKQMIKELKKVMKNLVG